MTLRRNARHAKPRWMVLVTILALGAFTLGISTVLGAHASVGSSNFEITDGNLKLDAASPHIDWKPSPKQRRTI